MKPFICATGPLILALAAALAQPAMAGAPPAPGPTAITPIPSSPADLPADQGVARMRCKASAEGMLSDCSVVAELPAGVGVGNAALKQISANPHVNGAPAGGGMIEANFRVPLTPDQIAAKSAIDQTVYTQLDWAKTPSAAQIAAAYPARAAEAGISGNVTLSCIVAVTGALGKCSVLRESPPGEGFGDAARRLTQYFQMTPHKVAGAPVAGTAVIPFPFVPPRR